MNSKFSVNISSIIPKIQDKGLPLIVPVNTQRPSTVPAAGSGNSGKKNK